MPHHIDGLVWKRHNSIADIAPYKMVRATV